MKTVNKHLVQLNSIVAPYFKELEKELNMNTTVLEMQVGEFYHVPTHYVRYKQEINIEKNGNKTIYHPVAGVLRDVMKKESDKHIVQIERVIGYATASRIISGVRTPHDILKYTIKEMLQTLNDEIGFGPEKLNAGQYYCKFGRNGVYLDELAECAGYELVLTSDTWLCETEDKL